MHRLARCLATGGRAALRRRRWRRPASRRPKQQPIVLPVCRLVRRANEPGVGQARNHFRLPHALPGLAGGAGRSTHGPPPARAAGDWLAGAGWVRGGWEGRDARQALGWLLAGDWEVSRHPRRLRPSRTSWSLINEWSCSQRPDPPPQHHNVCARRFRSALRSSARRGRRRHARRTTKP